MISRSDDDDALWVERALDGSPFAQAKLFERHGAAVLGLLTRMLGSRSDAEDAAQDVFVLAFRDLAKLRGEFGGWVRGIAVHQAHRRFRRRKLLHRLGLGPPLDATFDRVVDVSADAETRRRMAELQALVDTLSADERTAWMLRHVEGYELSEIAAMMALSLATVKRRLASAEARTKELR